SDIDILFAPETIERIEREVFEEMGIFLVIHMDPIEVDNEVVDRCRELVIDAIVSLEAGITMHDFRMVSGEGQTNLIFDIVVSHDYSDREAEALVDKIKALVHEKNNSYQCVITVDRSYT
ncbi:MAG: cation-efflux pump, partial [Oscillospiraceae bacterium]|nr:cation-efflux pump [Oscillospiraceae bacterium]